MTDSPSEDRRINALEKYITRLETNMEVESGSGLAAVIDKLMKAQDQLASLKGTGEVLQTGKLDGRSKGKGSRQGRRATRNG